MKTLEPIRQFAAGFASTGNVVALVSRARIEQQAKLNEYLAASLALAKESENESRNNEGSV